MSTPPRIEFYIDIISPFAYIAYYLTRHSPTFTPLHITYTPILLGGLIQQTGGLPPLSIRNKDKWINSERLRLASAFSIPMSAHTPANFPFPTIKCQRLLVYLAQNFDQTTLVRAMDALFHALWIDGENVNDEAVLEKVLREKVLLEGCGFEAGFVESALKGSASEVVKRGLKENTATAYREGAFGLPWFVARNERGEKMGFWGVDRLASLLAFVGRGEEAEGVARALL